MLFVLIINYNKSLCIYKSVVYLHSNQNTEIMEKQNEIINKYIDKVINDSTVKYGFDEVLEMLQDIRSELNGFEPTNETL